MEVTCLIFPSPPQLPCPQQTQVNCTGKLQGQRRWWLRYEDYPLNPSPLHIAPANRHRWTGEVRDWPTCTGGSQGSSTGREDGGHLFNPLHPTLPPPPTNRHRWTGEVTDWPAHTGGSKGSSTGREDGGHLLATEAPSETRHMHVDTVTIKALTCTHASKTDAQAEREDETRHAAEQNNGFSIEGFSMVSGYNIQ